MASTIRFLDNLLDKLKLLGNLKYTEIDGNYLLFLDDIEFGLVYDDKFVVYDSARARELIPYAKEIEVIRYGKTIVGLHVSEIGNRIVLKELVTFIVNDIKKKKEFKK